MIDEAKLTKEIESKDLNGETTYFLNHFDKIIEKKLKETQCRVTEALILDAELVYVERDGIIAQSQVMSFRSFISTIFENEDPIAVLMRRYS